jgi:hypothetical protein
MLWRQIAVTSLWVAIVAGVRLADVQLLLVVLSR